jgi:hypothetical protein
MEVQSITAMMAMSVLAKEAGAIEFFTKPFRDQDLLDAIQVAVDGDRGRQANPQQHQDAAESPRFWTEPNSKDRAHRVLCSDSMRRLSTSFPPKATCDCGWRRLLRSEAAHSPDQAVLWLSPRVRPYPTRWLVVPP